MPSVLLELGELEHIHDSLNLKLRTNVTLSLSPLSPFSISGSADLETLISTGTWIAGGNRLQIHVRFILDDIEIPDGGNASIVEEIGVRLCNAEIWSQLGLDATHNVPEIATEGSDRAANELVLTLSGQTIGHTTVNAPESVRSACLESISLLFNFSTCRRIRIASNIREQSTALVWEAEHTASLRSHDVDAIDMFRGPLRSEQQWPRLDAESHYQEQDKAIGSPSERQMFSRIASHPSSFVMPMSNSQGSVFSMPSRSLGSFSTYLSHSSSLGCKHATQQTRFEHLLRMLNASLRLAICDREAPKREGVILAKDTGFPRLVGISPALFSPGFLEAVSRRNSLLPNIAHRMCGVYRRTRSRGLNRKIERLLETFPDGNLAHDSTRSDDPQSNKASLPAAIQARLWYLMQHNLLNLQAWPKRKTEILSGPQTKCERELGSYMLDDLLPDQNTETGWNDEDVDLLLEGQYTLGKVKSGVSDHPFDEPEGTGAQYSNNDPFTNRNVPIDNDRMGEDLLWPEWRTASDEGSAEEGLSYGQTETLEAGDDMDEDLFRSETDLQGPQQDIRTDMLGDISSAEQDYYSQASCEGHAQCKPTKLWDNHREEILDNEQDMLKDHQIHPDDQCGSCRVVLEGMLNEPNNVLYNGLAHCSARAEDHQGLLDARQDSRNTSQDFPEGFALDAPGQMDHEEVLDDVEITLQSNQVSSEWFPPYTPWEQGHQERLDKTEIISDPQTATVPDAAFTKDFFGYDGDEMLDGEHMTFDADQGNQALIMV